MFDTKFVIVVMEDLPTWQKLNVTAFLSTGVASSRPDIIGDEYRDTSGNTYHPMCIQPIVILSSNNETLSKIHDRALRRGVQSSVFIEEMFSTGHDGANRAVFARFSPETAKVVGIAFHADKKIADKISKGARMHP